MAKKKKSTPRRPPRRRIGSPFSDFATVIGGAIIGGIGAQALGNMASKAGITSPEMQAGGKIAAGFLIGQHSKGALGKGIGIGMAVNGGTHFAQKLGVIHGLDDDGMGDFDDMGAVEGAQNWAALPDISGMPDDDM
jgi:hypothetical protein